MTTPLPPDESFVLQIAPIVAKTLASEFADLPLQAQAIIQRQTLVTSLNIHRKAKKKRLNLTLFTRRVLREQVQVWLATYGTPNQQAAAMNQIMVNNRSAVASYLNPKQFKFRTSDIADEVLNDAFQSFFDGLSQQKPVEALLSTCVISIAHKKALQQLRSERSGPSQQLVWLETTFVTIDDAEIGSLIWPLTRIDDDEFTTVTLPTANADTPTKLLINVDKLRQWVADCFASLNSARQLLFRLRYQIWTDRDLQNLSIEEVGAILSDLNMDEIARMAGYPNAHTASARLTESRIRLRKCLTTKLTSAPI